MRPLDLADIQGTIVHAYARDFFVKARYFFFNSSDDGAGRAFIDAIRPRITSALPWKSPAEKPPVAVSIGFSYRGLEALGVPSQSLRLFPDEFIDGMRYRAGILGDVGPSAPDGWDEIWRKSNGSTTDAVHTWIALDAQAKPDGTPVAELAASTQWLRDLVRNSDGGVRLLGGHGPEKADFQEASALMAPLPDGSTMPIPKEHFGFSDGIGDPVYEGQLDPAKEALGVVGQGKLVLEHGKAVWKPLAAGEFVLGHVDESQEVLPAAQPPGLMRNGSFLAYRKLHQNTGSFDRYIDEKAVLFQKLWKMATLDEAKATLRAKMVGRWEDGVPLMVAPDYAAWQPYRREGDAVAALRVAALRAGRPLSAPEQTRCDAYERMRADFRYGGDAEGSRCPVSSHIRRTNTRDMLDPNPGPQAKTSVLNNRRRILRRGLPYGRAGDAASRADAGEHGIVFMAVCASLFRQFEFVQQQWINYGLDANAGNDTCPLIGMRTRDGQPITDTQSKSDAKFVIPADPESGNPPFICANIPPFVTTRGGEYFFLPSLSALRLLAMGMVDPT